MALIEAHAVWKVFPPPEVGMLGKLRMGKQRMPEAMPGEPLASSGVVALRDVELSIDEGAFVLVTGVSGSGKSTLLSLLGGLDRPTRGSIRLGEVALEAADERRLSELRRDRIGFVFQDFRLIRHLSAFDNVMLPWLLSGRPVDERRARRLLERVNLGHRLRHHPDSLSRGEMQRVALVRALVHRPDLLIADEPTANLDADNAELIWQALHTGNREMGLTVVVATHDPSRATEASQVTRLHHGEIEWASAAGELAGGVRK